MFIEPSDTRDGPTRISSSEPIVLDRLGSVGDPRRFFLATYLRTTLAVRDELAAGGFRDGGWVEEWDVVFAGLNLDALERAERSDPVPLPWAVAFGTVGQPPLRHVLLGMNAHVLARLPQEPLGAQPVERPQHAVGQRRAADQDEFLVLRRDPPVLLRLAVGGFGVRLAGDATSGT